MSTPVCSPVPLRPLLWLRGQWKTAVDSTTLSRISLRSEEPRFSFLSRSRTISGQTQLFSLKLKLMSRGASWARGQVVARGQFTVRYSCGPGSSPRVQRQVCLEASAGLSAKAVGVCRPRRALVKADKRKHLLTCHYEESARPGLSQAPRNTWLLPAQREKKKKAEKRPGFSSFPAKWT